MLRTTVYLSLILGSALLFAACGPPPPPTEQSSSALPEITQELIDERINDARVYDVLPESGSGEPIPWSFDWDEPKQVVEVERQINGNRATIILDVKTQSSPQARNLRHLSGQIRTEWELKTGWALRRWEIVNTENISMKYKELPKPPPPPTQ